MLTLSTHDAALDLLVPYLQAVSIPTLWFADENVLPLLQQLSTESEKLHIICNRYDIYQLAVKQGFSVEYGDFYPISYQKTPVRILYRVSKEKLLVHYLLGLSAQYLQQGGELVLTGQKQDGIKGYHSTLSNSFACTGHQKKMGTAYIGNYTHFQLQADSYSASNKYQRLDKVYTDHSSVPFFYSKPGVFGWRKIDRGSELLLRYLFQFLDRKDISIHSLLDLGCGYGWLFMNLARYYRFDKVVATDNNPAALLCAQKNSDFYALNVDIVASDAGDNLTGNFDLIVCNPPFHQGFKHSQPLTHKFISAITKQLHKTGSAFLVVSEFVPAEKIARDCLLKITQLCRQDGFKVLELSR